MTQRQTTFLFDMKYTCVLKIVNKALLYYYSSLITLRRSRNQEIDPSCVCTEVLDFPNIYGRMEFYSYCLD